MCGIAGFLTENSRADDAKDVLAQMVDSITHRGPDAGGAWLDPEQRVALGHRRLSILDLSPAGSQPMESPSGRYIMIFNGEAYNHLELREALGAGVAWRGRSDTETLLVAFERYGVEETLRRVVGMFALALWDRHQNELTLARDRLGEKPLYYGWQGNVLLFGSELKALKHHPAFAFELDQNSLSAYLKYGYVPAPHSIYQGVNKLRPGHVWRYRLGSPNREGVLTQYWSLAAVASQAEPFTGSDEKAIDELERLLSRSIELQRVADVPLGAFLSGGIDSSTVVALMQRLSSTPVRTFTVGFGESEFDESRAAARVAKHLGTDHTEITVAPQESLNVIPLLPHMFDEPFGDVSAIPTWLLAKLARTQVTVSLSGDGGDELFAGYDRYHRTAKLWQRAQKIGPAGRALARSGLGVLPAGTLQRELMRRKIGGFPHLFVSRIEGIRAAFGEGAIDAAYDRRMSHWGDPRALLKSASDPATSWAREVEIGRADPTERMMAFDTLTYMPDDVLVKVDRAAMAHGLETRVPLLDHRIVAFAWSLPHRLRVRDGASKWLLRQLLYRHVPKALVDRPKQGFGVPMGAWLRGPLKEWAEEHLQESCLRAGPLQPEPIRQLWSEHLSGAADWQHRLWPVLAFLEWEREDASVRASSRVESSLDVSVAG